MTELIQRTKCRSRNQRGHSLTEVVAAMTISVLIVTACLPILSRLYIARNAIRDEVTWQQSVHEIGVQLRRDIRGANQATVKPDQDRILTLISAAGATTTYQLTAGELQRTTHIGDQTVREGYTIAPGTIAEWRIREQPSSMVSLKLTIPLWQTKKTKQTKPRELEITTALGTDRGDAT